ncbi:MAG: hypothetical protein MPJ50_14925 [Pirellulales bacterium]|nr:hypothetical protein [Pirellulales bacterium]
MNIQDQPVPVMCRYRVKPGQDTAFEEILRRHWQTIHDLGLTTDEPARLWRADDMAGNVAYFESFSWRKGDSAQTAHETPGVMRLWEPMGALCEDMEFWNVKEIQS